MWIALRKNTNPFACKQESMSSTQSGRPSSRKGSNSVQIRRYNERVVLEALQRLGKASKADLARSANLTPQAVATIVDYLAEVGLVKLEGKRVGQVGQPSTLYAPSPDCPFPIGLP